MIHGTRVKQLSDAPIREREYVLYWMQASQRAGCNHALEYAVRRADELRVPVVVGFGLYAGFPQANARHFGFMLQGLQETREALRARGIQLVVRKGMPHQGALAFASRACMIVCDRGYLRHQKRWRELVAAEADCRVVQVESDAVVPVEVASDREEYAARTFRPRLHRHLDEYLVALEEAGPDRDSLDLRFLSADVSDWRSALDRLYIDRSVELVPGFVGGTAEARRRLREFIDHRLATYHQYRSEPVLGWSSHLSPYLHFGEIAPLEVALEVAAHDGEGPEAFLEELIVRRELCINFCEYNPRYDTVEALPEWAQTTLRKHVSDPRLYSYTWHQLAAADTHDDYWNAAQTELLETGQIHNTMRMYWGKKILEWSERPHRALALIAGLNNRFALDGRDPVSWGNFAWVLGKHDRAWQERPIFGKVRYLNAAGLERKYDIGAYVRKLMG